MDIGHILQSTFAAARRLADDPDARYVVIVRPNRTILAIPCPPAGSVPVEEAAKVGSLLPDTGGRTAVIITPTEFTVDSSELQAAGAAIPFFGLLMKMAYSGNSVLVFDGQLTGIPAACNKADLLLIDSALATKLTTRHVDEAVKVMRNANVLVHDRATFQLRILKKAGSSSALEFPN